jgi:hypothetical protein
VIKLSKWWLQLKPLGTVGSDASLLATTLYKVSQGGKHHLAAHLYAHKKIFTQETPRVSPSWQMTV